MSRRIEVELTSARPDGTWTWRAAGAREPKGVLPADLLGREARVGDVLRVEVDSDIDGITVLGVLPSKGARKEPERLEIIGSDRAFEPVTSTLVAGRDRPRRERGDRPRREGDQDRRERRPRSGRPDGPSGPGTTEGRDGPDGRGGRDGRDRAGN